jgi:hypothetical protein
MGPDKRQRLRRKLEPVLDLGVARLGMDVELRSPEGMDDAQVREVFLLVFGKLLPGRIGVAEVRFDAFAGKRPGAEDRCEDRNVRRGTVDMPEERAPQIIRRGIDLRSMLIG